MILSRIAANVSNIPRCYSISRLALKGLPTATTESYPRSPYGLGIPPFVSCQPYSTPANPTILPPTISPKALGTETRRRALLTFLLRPVRLHLSSHSYDLAVHTFRTRTLPRLARQPNPSQLIRNAYVSLLRSLLIRRAANPALALYTAMTSLHPEVVLPRLLKAQLELSVSTTLEPANVTGHRRVLSRAISGIGFTPEDMLALARFLAIVLRWRPTHIGRAILDYLSIHPAPQNTPEGIPTKRMNDKFKRIYAHLTELVQNPAVLERLARAGEAKQEVNTEEMAELPRNTRPDHIRAWLDTRGVAPDASTLASLIELQYSRGRYDRACALYGLFTTSPQPEDGRAQLLPPAKATRAMFNVVRAFEVRAAGSQPRTHLSRQERFPLAEDLPSSRTLFRNMFFAHQTQMVSTGRSNALSAAALHTALREFLREGDYAGAYVILRAFSLASSSFEITPCWTTWRVVVQAVAGRVQTELAALHGLSRSVSEEDDLFVQDEDDTPAPDAPPISDPKERNGEWLDRLLGPLKRELALFRDRSSSLLLAYLVLRLSQPQPTRVRSDDENARVDPDALVLIPTPPPTPETLSHSVTPDHGFVPSPQMLCGEQAHPLPAVRKWDIRPLERLVLRVLDADVGETLSGGADWKEAAREKAKLIKEAKAAMIPSTKREDATKDRTKRRSAKAQ